MQVLSRWRLKKDKRWQKLKDKIADTAETERQDRRHGNEGESSPRLQDNTAKTLFTESRFTERFTANMVYREPRDCNMYRDCTSSPRAKRL